MRSFVLLAFVACANAGVLLRAPVAAPVAVVETGVSTQSRTQDTLGNYVFAYDENHTTGGTFRKEVGDALGNKAGSYGLSTIDGRVRTVNYVADAAGFRVDIKTNEEGVGATATDPANTSINKKEIVVEASAPILASAIIPESVSLAKTADPKPAPAPAPAPEQQAPAPAAIEAPQAPPAPAPVQEPSAPIQKLPAPIQEQPAPATKSEAPSAPEAPAGPANAEVDKIRAALDAENKKLNDLVASLKAPIAALNTPITISAPVAAPIAISAAPVAYSTGPIALSTGQIGFSSPLAFAAPWNGAVSYTSNIAYGLPVTSTGVKSW